MGVRADEANIRYWLAVPFAASTGEENMWKAPVPRAPWDYVLDCTNWGAGCLSPHHNADVPKNTSQDCLNLNIFVPANAKGPLPVMLFFNGGAFEEGSNQGPFDIYSGAYIASSKDVVIVSAGYRLGAFGFFSLADAGVAGNFGLLDQRAAMQWVQKNIALVGGDPARVTIFGESAGAMSIGLHLVSPASKGLFRAAIMESNPSAFQYKDEAEAGVYGATFCGLMNCTTGPLNACNVSCLRAADPQVITDRWNTATGNVWDWIITNLLPGWHILDGILTTLPTITGPDGDFPINPLRGFASGQWPSQVPLLLGTNSNEGETFIYDAVDFYLPAAVMPYAYEGVFGVDNGRQIAAQPRYNCSDELSDGRVQLSHLVTDYLFRCSSSTGFATAAVKAGLPVYVYRFDHLYSNASVFPSFGLPKICAETVCHASELPFVFHNTPNTTEGNFTFTPAEAVLSRNMVDYWVSFATHLDPNVGRNESSIVWPKWDPATKPTMVFNLSLVIESSKPICDFWDGLGYFF